MDTNSYTVKEIYNFEINHVKSSDFIIANLTQGKSTGTSHELAIANEYNIPVIALVNNVNILSDVNAFDKYCVSKCFDDIDKLIEYVIEYYILINSFH